MLLSKEILEQISPIEAEYVYAYIYNLYHKKVTPETTNYENLSTMVECCPHCGSVHFIKYGFTNKGRQKYRCKDCNSIFGPTTGTLFAYSNTSYKDWIQFIACEINGQTLDQETISIGKSRTTCFNMRHKLYSAVKKIQENIVLKGQIQLDPAYTKINLKGTKPQNMPRISKIRGKHKTNPNNKELAGISHHKICLISAKDEHDNILFKIAGLGPETIEKLVAFGDYFEVGSTIISDSKPCIINFANQSRMISETIPVIANQQRYTTKKGNSLSEINQIHQEFAELIRKKHGVSTRHLQGYIDWLVFCKQLKYKIDGKRRKVESYVDVMKEYITLKTRTISSKPMPIDLYEAYGEYNYGIFSNPPTI